MKYSTKFFIEAGKKGGEARAKNLTANRRSEIARIAGSSPKKKNKKSVDILPGKQ